MLCICLGPVAFGQDKKPPAEKDSRPQDPIGKKKPALAPHKEYRPLDYLEAMVIQRDGKAVVVAGRITLKGKKGPELAAIRVDLVTGTDETLVSPSLLSITTLAFSPNEKKLLIGGFAGQGKAQPLRICDLAKGTEEKAQAVTMGVWGLASMHPVWKKDAGDEPSDPKKPRLNTEMAHVAATNGEVKGEILLWNLETGKTMGVLKGHTEVVTAMAFLADGRLVSGADKSLRIWDTAAKKQVASRAHKSKLWSVAVAPDGNTIAFADDSSVCLLTPDKIKDEPTRIAFPKGNLVRKLAFSPDGKHLAGASSEIFVWNVENQKEVANLRSGGDPPKAIAYTSDGKSLVVATQNGTVRVYSVEKLKKVSSNDSENK
jgi:WD40 repeat protein